MGDKIRIGGAHKWAKHYITPAFSGIPKDMREKIRIGGAHKWAKPDITRAFSGIPKDMGNKSRFGGAHKWAEMLHHPCILRDPEMHSGQNQNWWGPQVGGNATSLLHSQGSPKAWEQNQNWWGPQVG